MFPTTASRIGAKITASIVPARGAGTPKFTPMSQITASTPVTETETLMSGWMSRK